MYRLGLMVALLWLLHWECKGQAHYDSLTLSMEFRPRTELRNGYRQLRTDSSLAAFHTDQRSRIYIHYKRPGFIFHTSIQDVRIWGAEDPRSTQGTLQIFETYAEPALSPSLSVRIGKQKIMYDNQRLFAQNNWRQNGGTHDAVRFIYQKRSWEGDLIGAFNQESDADTRFSGTDFSPVFSSYKVLLANFLRYTSPTKTIFTAINVVDAFQDQNNVDQLHWRFTSGGRIEKTVGNTYLTLAAYYQYGENTDGLQLNAYYYQPEIKVTAKPWVVRLGAEVFSGDDGLNPDGRSRSFDALYGVNHRFLGSMDFFTNFPEDLNNAGLVAPYVFAFYDLNKTLTLRADGHLFYSQNNFVETGQTSAIDKFLGFENDWLPRFNPNSYTELDLGYSYTLTTESMTIIKKGGNSDLFQSWAFVMVTFNPELFSWGR